MHGAITKTTLLVTLVCLAWAWGCSTPVEYDVLIRGGTVYDGTGSAPVSAELAIQGESIAAIGDLAGATRKTEKSTSIRVWNPSGFEAETSLQHDDVGRAGVGGRKSSMP